MSKKKKKIRQLVKLTGLDKKFQYHTTRSSTNTKLSLNKYNPITRKHEKFEEVKK